MQNAWDNLLGWRGPEGMLIARDMGKGDSILKCKLAPQRLACPLLPCTACRGSSCGGWCGRLAWDYPGKKDVTDAVSVPSLLWESSNMSDSSPSLQESCMCSGHVPAAHHFRSWWIAGYACVLTHTKHMQAGSITGTLFPHLQWKVLAALGSLIWN